LAKTQTVIADLESRKVEEEARCEAATEELKELCAEYRLQLESKQEELATANRSVATIKTEMETKMASLTLLNERCACIRSRGGLQ